MKEARMQRTWWILGLAGWLMLCQVGNCMAQEGATDEPVEVTLSVQKLPLVEVLHEIERQTGITFSYESSLVKGLNPVQLKVEKVSLEECLQQLLKSYPISFHRKGKVVILKKKQRAVTISGFVRNALSAEALVGASVTERSLSVGTPTDSTGRFRLSFPMEEELSLTFSYIGYESRVIHFPALRRDTSVVVALQPNARLREVLVTGSESGRQPVRNAQMGLMEVDQATIRTTPTLLGECDIIRTLQLTPGVSVGTEGISGLYVRGGGGDENLFLVDGNPLYQVNHLGGLFSAFNGEAIKRMDFYKAGFPARYGGRLSSVVDIQTEEGNKREFHGSATLGLLSGGLQLEGPIVKDQTSFNVALRRTWLDVFSASAMAIVNRRNRISGTKLNVRYAFHDLNARIDHQLNAKNKLYVGLYNGNDMLKVFHEETGSRWEKDDVNLRWGSLLAMAGWNSTLHEKLTSKLSFAYMRYRSKIGYLKDQGNSSGVDYVDNYKHTLDELSNVNSITDYSLRASFNYQPVPSHFVRFGADYQLHLYSPEYYRGRRFHVEGADSSFIQESLPCTRFWGHEVAAYVEDDWEISPVVRLNAGLRMNLFHVGSKTYAGLEPRLAMRWLLTPDVSVKASYSRMRQYVHLVSSTFLSLPTDSWMPVTDQLRPLRSDQVSIGGYYNWKKKLDFSFEVYYKWLHNLLEYKENTNLLPSSLTWEDKLTAGDGRAYGTELMVRKPEGRLTGWVGYALSWADQRFPELNRGRRFPSRYDNRHKLNIVAMWKLSKRVELSAAWTFASGNRVTVSLESYDQNHPHLNGHSVSFIYDNSWNDDYYEGRNNVRLPAYHRLDVGLNIYRPKKKGRMGIWNISLYNAYCRMNAITIWKGYVDDEKNPSKSREAFKAIGIFPVIPSVSYTYKF